jgi:hypothetical protein
MKKFVIERTIPGAGKLSADELKAIAETSCDVVSSLGTPYYWLETFVTDNKMYCVHIAENEGEIRKHAEIAGFPADSVSEVKSIIGPSLSAKKTNS